MVIAHRSLTTHAAMPKGKTRGWPALARALVAADLPSPSCGAVAAGLPLPALVIGSPSLLPPPGHPRLTRVAPAPTTSALGPVSPLALLSQLPRRHAWPPPVASCPPSTALVTIPAVDNARLVAPAYRSLVELSVRLHPRGELSDLDPIELQSQKAKVLVLCTCFAFDLSHIA
jgi:hypothetical protein